MRSLRDNSWKKVLKSDKGTISTLLSLAILEKSSEIPIENVDRRPLSERLAEQRLLKEEEFQSKIRSANRLGKLEEEDVKLMEERDAAQRLLKLDAILEEKQAMEQFRVSRQNSSFPARTAIETTHSKKVNENNRKISMLIRRKAEKTADIVEPDTSTKKMKDLADYESD